ncbi:MAG: enolase C-terminal domain-like protein, partial [Fidelibacterota bacterium]
MKVSWTKRTLNLKSPIGTSRGIMKTRVVWYLFLTDGGATGIGECAPLPGLSIDDFDQIESKLDEVCANPKNYIENLSLLKTFPSIRCGLEMAYIDLKNGGGQNYFDSLLNQNESIDINGLIWMGNSDSMMRQVEQKLDEGWGCIKIKIGALDFDTEINILKSIRSRLNRNKTQLRVDANGAFTESDVKEKLNRLAEFDLHSIEQPIKAGQWELLTELCQSSPVSIALDEELISIVDEANRIEMLDVVKPQYLVLKPSLLGGFAECEKWIKLAGERKIGWWLTSALESNIGLNAITQWTSKMKPEGFQGLGTGQLYTNNIPSPINIKSGKLWKDDAPIWTDVNLFVAEWLSPGKTMELQTSGSTGEPKILTVQKEWMSNSAQLTGRTFGLKKGETALLCLPMKYIAGKMMVVRALELDLDLKVVEPSSRPLEEIEDTVGFTAMVPLQLEKSLNHLYNVKTVIVGGGKVHSQLVEKLQSLPLLNDPSSVLPYDRGENKRNYPKQLNSSCATANRGNTRGSIKDKEGFQSTKVYETYGMTETLTHVAVKPLNGPNQSEVFTALNGVRFETDERDCLVIYAAMVNPEPVITNDIVELINETSFKWLGRFDNVINSGGVKIIPEVLEAKLAPVMYNRRFFITGEPDDSLGEKVVLVVEG